MTERALGERNTAIGKYRIIEARNIYNPSPETAHWRVYDGEAMDPISIHSTRAYAIAAVRRLHRMVS